MRADTTPAPARDLPAIWDTTRARVITLTHGLTDEAAGAAVRTVPGATVRDVLAHLVHTATLAARSPAVVRDGIVAHPPVGAGQGVTVGTLAAEWKSAAAAARVHLSSDSKLAAVLITDTAMSEHDIRTALDSPGARDDVAIKVALDELSARFSDRVAASNLPALRVTVEQWGTIAGAGHAISCVVADRFEFVRAMSGRRSAAEIRRWNWGVAPDPYLPVISEVALPAQDVREADPRIPAHMRDREFVL